MRCEERERGQCDGSASFKNEEIFNPSQQSDLHPLKVSRKKNNEKS
jgi:hypothetical protein